MNPTFIYRKVLASTNDFIETMVDSENIAEGTVVYCSEQMAGRGQGDNSWESNPNENITFSVFLKPQFLDAGDQFYLNKAICVGICRFLESFVEPNRIKIKWPNDIYIDDCKIAGILIEHTIMADKLNSSIIGVGLNVNQTVFHEAPNPISLKMITGSDFDVDVLLKSLVDCILKSYEALYSDMFAYDEEYLNILYRKGVFAMYSYKKSPIRAMIIEVNTYGQLIIVDDSGMQYCCNQRELLYLR